MRRLLISLLLLHANILYLQAETAPHLENNLSNPFRFAAPVLGNLNGDMVAWPGIGNTVVLDAGGNATVGDAEYDASNSGLGNYNGAKLVVKRRGTAVSSDVFGLSGSTLTLDASVGRIKYNNRAFGTFTNANGILTINIQVSEITPTKQVVNELVRAITYRNDQPAGNTIIDISLSDATATTTAGVIITSGSIYVNNTVHAATIDASDGTSLAEAIAIANAQNGTSTIHLVTANSSTVNLGANTNLNKSALLRINQNIGISGNSINIANGATLTIEQGNGTHTIQTSLQGMGTFQNSAAAIFNLRGSNSIARMNFNAGTINISTPNNLSSTGVTFNNGTTLTILRTGAASTTFQQPLQFNGTVTVNTETEANAIFDGIISGNGTFTKTGGGTATLLGANTLSGVLNISAGVLVIQNPANMLGGNLTLSGGRLQITGNATISQPINITGTSSSIEVDPATQATLTGQINGSGRLLICADEPARLACDARPCSTSSRHPSTSDGTAVHKLSCQRRQSVTQRR
ncbi:MAG: hypothetical protein EOO39_20430 [Cytophagaceae bacterium]|nr:MAG: hypothetical protein EOO39_20430 [Cytophagaceae bacterium]